MTDSNPTEKVELEAPAQPTAAEELASSTKTDADPKLNTNGDAGIAANGEVAKVNDALAEKLASPAEKLDAPAEKLDTPVEEPEAPAGKQQDPTEDQSDHDEDKKADSAKRKASETNDKGSKKPKYEGRQWKKNIKSEYSTLPGSSDPDEIRKQVEFYFSDSNLYQDQYLYNLVGGSDNNSVPIKVIHSFKRMHRFQPFSAVVAALKESETLDIIDDRDGEEIRRKVALEPRGKKTRQEYFQTFEDKTVPRSIYAKGFGKESSTTQIDIEDFFAPYGPINAIRLRRTHPEKLFKGSVFVEFDCEETQQEFLKLDPKPKYNGQELEIKSKKEYCDLKVEDIRSGKIKPNEDRNPRGHDSNHRHNRGGRDNRDNGKSSFKSKGNWKSQRDNFQRGGFRDRSCYNCGEEGHRASHCPNEGKSKDKSSSGDENADKELKRAGAVKEKSREVGNEDKAEVKSTAENGSTDSKKRMREEAEDADGVDVKKLKGNEVEAAA